MTFAFVVVALLASVPALLGMTNCVLLRRPKPQGSVPKVAILIPARNEESTIHGCVTSALMTTDADVEVIVLDDGSSDRTADIVARLASADKRVRLGKAPPLPSGWKGKTHACHVLSTMTVREFMLFVDADVRLSRDAVARLVPRPGIDLISGVPHQTVGSVLEAAVVPMINTVIYFYLPIYLMRRRKTDPALAAACGQLIMVRKSAYGLSGGHASIAHAMHDGLGLARNFRRNGFATDLVDATGLASCRMYANAVDLWRGFGKNATEGMAKPLALPIWTVLLVGGLVAPFALAPLAWPRFGHWDASLLVASALLLAVSRTLQAVRCRERPSCAMLMPFGVLITLVIQWNALIRYWQGRTVMWRDRVYRPQV